MEENFNQLQQSHRRRKRRLAFGVAFAAIAMVFLAWYFTHLGEQQTKSASPTSSVITPLEKRTTGAGSRDASNAKSRADLNSSSSTGNPKAKTFLESKFKNRTPAICGLTESEAEAYVASDGAIGASLGSRALAEVTSKFVQSTDLREKTLGLYLAAHQAGWDAADAERRNYPGCQSPDDCASKPYTAATQARSVNAEPLVKLALSSKDANVYAAALYACSGAKTGACGSVTYLRWAEMDANNAAAWLMAASEAASAKEITARDAALQRALTANDYDLRSPMLENVLTAESMQAQPAIAQSSIAMALVGVSALITNQTMTTLTRYCGRTEMLDVARRVTCDALASKVAEKDQTVLSAIIAKSIGGRAGWSAERLQALQDEYTIVSGRGMEFIVDENMFSCDTITKSNQYIKRMFAIGERAASREIVEKSGKSQAETADAYRKLMPIIVK